MKIRIRKRVIAVAISLAITVVLGTCYADLDVASKKVNEIKLKLDKNTTETVEGVKFDIYLPNKELTKLEIKSVEGKYTNNKSEIVKLVVSEISKNLVERGIVKNEIVMLNSFFSGKDLYINLKSIEEFKGDSKKNLYILYSMANSIIDLGGVERVKFLVDNSEKSGVFDKYYQKNTDL